MGVKDSFSSASVLLKVALILIILANFFSWIAFTTTSWAVSKVGNVHIGIWRLCSSVTFSSCTNMDGTASDWYEAFQAFSVIAFVTLTLSGLLVVLFTCGPKCQGDSEAGMACGILAIVAAVCWLVAIIIFGAEYPDDTTDLDYSFALAVIALALAAIGGIVALLSAKNVSGSTQPSA